MKTDRLELTIKEIIQGYHDDDDGQIVGYGGRLNIRPSYQREYIHDDNLGFKEALIQSIYHERPANLIYFAQSASSQYDYELLDGQQRIITICKFIMNSEFAVNIHHGVPNYWQGLSNKEQDRILNYSLHIYVCEGDSDELMRWFKTINTGAEKLSDQELRNSIYNGPWVTDAKKYFTKKGGQEERCKKYMTGKRERQEHLERILQWRVGSTKDSEIRKYMSEHRANESAEPLWNYFLAVYDWIERTFGIKVNSKRYRSTMKQVDWGWLYAEFKDRDFDPKEITEKVDRLFKCGSKEISQKGIYPLVLTGEEKYMSLRAFTVEQRRAAYERQGGKCAITGDPFPIEEMEADHIKPWSEGGKTDDENCHQIRYLWVASGRNQ